MRNSFGMTVHENSRFIEFETIEQANKAFDVLQKLHFIEAAQPSVQRTVEACRADHDAFQRMRHCPEFCPSCGERLHSR